MSLEKMQNPLKKVNTTYLFFILFYFA